jgi:hypothetical protein
MKTNTARAEEIHTMNIKSLFADVKNTEHSTVAWLEKEITVIEGKEPAIGKVIDAGLKYVGLASQIALTATGDPAAAAIVGAVVNEARTDLAVVSATVADFGPTPDAAAAFTAVQTNLSGLLTAGHVTSTTSVAAVTKAVSEVGVIASAVQVAAQAIAAAAAPLPTAA